MNQNGAWSPSALAAAEVQFLTYRLDVVASWPDSGRKRASLTAISLRLKSLAGIPNP
jgi:hypothetical protein